MSYTRCLTIFSIVDFAIVIVIEKFILGLRLWTNSSILWQCDIGANRNLQITKLSWWRFCLWNDICRKLTPNDTIQPSNRVVSSSITASFARMLRLTSAPSSITTLSQRYAPSILTLLPILQFLPMTEFATREFSPTTVPEPNWTLSSIMHDLLNTMD
jgi:hypothetical protein